MTARARPPHRAALPKPAAAVLTAHCTVPAPARAQGLPYNIGDAVPTRSRRGDVGLGYYGNCQYRSGRNLLLKADLATLMGSSDAASGYNCGTIDLMQAGFTF